MKKPEITLPINEPKMIRGLFMEGGSALKSIPDESKAFLRRCITRKLDGLWGINAAIVDFNHYEGYGLAMSVFFANYDGEALESQKTVALEPLAIEEPKVRYIVDEIIQPVVGRYLGNGVSFAVSTE